MHLYWIYFALLFGACFVYAVASAPKLTVSTPVSKFRKDSVDAFPSKCNIPNMDKIQHMALVYTWVNGSLPCYRADREKFGGKRATGGSRDREIGELKYSVRSIEKYMSWHKGPVYFVTPAHIPAWLNQSHPRVTVVNQDDIVPTYAKRFLPLFNTHVLEQFLYLIPGLTELFLQVNDDYIFTNPVYPHDFFGCDGSIKIMQEKGSISHKPPTEKKGIWISSVLNTQQEMNKIWGEKDRKFLKHAPFVLSRQAFERVHQIFDRPMHLTLSSKFRSKVDMNNPLLHYYYLVHQGSDELGIPIQYASKEEMSGFQLLLLKNNNMDKAQGIFDNILAGKHDTKILTLNDEYSNAAVGNMAVQFLNEFLPTPSQFERKDGKDSPYTARAEGTCKVDNNLLHPVTVRPYKEPHHAAIKVQLESRPVLFLNALIRGAGLGLGCIFVISLYLTKIRSSTKNSQQEMMNKV